MKRKLLSLITLAAMVIGMIPAISASAAGGPHISAEVSQAYASNSGGDGGATGFIATLTGVSAQFDSELTSLTWTITPSDGSGAKNFTYTSSDEGFPSITLGMDSTAYVGLIINGLNDSGATAYVETTAAEAMPVFHNN